MSWRKPKQPRVRLNESQGRDPAGPGLERRLGACWDQQDAKTRRSWVQSRYPGGARAIDLPYSAGLPQSDLLWLKRPLDMLVNTAGLTPRLAPGCSLREQS